VTLPNFFVIGAGKSGTTSLYYYLEQHPEVYMSPIKEPNFFAFEGGVPDFRGPPGTPSPTSKPTAPCSPASPTRPPWASPEKAKKSPNLVHLGDASTPDRAL
jgi:hypothetical protein